MAVGLQKAGFRAEVLGQPDDHPPPNPPVTVHELPSRRSRLGRMVAGPTSVVRALAMRPTAIQIDSLDLLPWAALARLFMRIPMVYDSNEDYPSYMLIKEWLPRRLRPFVSRLVALVEPKLAARLDGTLVADAATAENFERSSTQLVVV